MARDFQINGESMISVRGSSSAELINEVQELGLTESPIRVSVEENYMDMIVDAWGNRVPADVQVMPGAATITMPLIHFDRQVLEDCMRESRGGATGTATAGPGTAGRAGIRLGGGGLRFSAACHYFSVYISSPQSAIPWRFFFCYMPGTPYEYPLGTERTVALVTFRCIPYCGEDPYSGGLTYGGSTTADGSFNALLWDAGNVGT